MNIDQRIKAQCLAVLGLIDGGEIKTTQLADEIWAFPGDGPPPQNDSTESSPNCEAVISVFLIEAGCTLVWRDTNREMILESLCETIRFSD